MPPFARPRSLVAALVASGALLALAPSAALGRGADHGASPSKKGVAGKAKARKRRAKSLAKSVEPPRHLPSLAAVARKVACPDDMVAVAGRVCVDRYEATLVDAPSGEALSPYYPPNAKSALAILETWTRERETFEAGTAGREMSLPLLPELQKGAFRAMASARAASVPSGYVSGEMAASTCAAAGKRLCNEAEWVTACRGERQTQFPYGERYVHGACNVFREEHPGHVLHGDFSTGLLDPRLNQVTFDGEALLRKTGESEACASRWGDDAIFDMVGNLDEWIDDPDGTFVGGFYARATRNGCDARVGAHPATYFDYSTGVRCCKDPSAE